MDAGSIDRLELKPGEHATAAQIAALDRKISANQGLRGVRVRRRQYPWGTHYSSYSRGGLVSAPVFAPDVTFRDKGVAEVRWSGPIATIAGLVPTIGANPKTAPEIFTPDPKTRLLPALTVDPTKYDDQGECRIYFKVTTFPGNFIAQSVQPILFTGLPPRLPYTAYKLALFLRKRNGQPTYQEAEDRELFSSQGFLACQQQPTGRFTPLFWALF